MEPKPGVATLEKQKAKWPPQRKEEARAEQFGIPTEESNCHGSEHLTEVRFRDPQNGSFSNNSVKPIGGGGVSGAGVREDSM